MSSMTVKSIPTQQIAQWLEISHMSMDKWGRLQDIPNIILGGIGDSFLAAQASVSFFKSMVRCSAGCCTKRDFPFVQVHPGTLVICSADISSSEVSEQIAAMGGQVLSAGHAADTKETDEADDRNTFAAGLLHFYSIAAKMSGVGTAPDPADILSSALEQVLRQSDQIAATAEQWKAAKSIELIGDEQDGVVCRWTASKLTALAGLHTPIANSEDWCHVNYFTLYPETVPVILLATRGSVNASRIDETMRQASAIGREVLLITDEPDRYTQQAGTTRILALPTLPAELRNLFPFVTAFVGLLLTSKLMQTEGE